MADDKEKTLSRRDLLRRITRGVGFGVVGAGAAAIGASELTQSEPKVWQLDPNKCVQCGNCATYCVLEVSAVKCVHSFELCGYCDFCTGYFEAQASELTTAAENALCPTGAIIRRKVEEQRFEYSIDEELCIGCAKCVKGCSAFGNGSLFLQVRHDRCLNCNECNIATSCPSDAFLRVPASKPYLLKGEASE